MSATTPAGHTPYYFVPAPSRHPVMVAFGLLLVIFGAGQWVNGAGWAAWVLLAGMVIWLSVLFQWFSQAIGESEGGLYNDRVDVSGSSSREVMFFAAFFGALYYARSITRVALARRPRPQGRSCGPISVRCGPTPARPIGGRSVPDHRAVADPDAQHRVAAHLRTDAHDRAPRAEGQPAAGRWRSGWQSP
jgi:hypothetical protein